MCIMNSCGVSLIVLGFIISTITARPVVIRIHVPQIIRHQQHTNYIYLKPHRPLRIRKIIPILPAKVGYVQTHHGHTAGLHHVQNDVGPYAHHHSYGHHQNHQHYSSTYGNGALPPPAPIIYEVHKKVIPSPSNAQLIHEPKYRLEEEKPEKVEKFNNYNKEFDDYPYNNDKFIRPAVKSGNTDFKPFSADLPIDDKKTIRYESVKIETNGDGIPSPKELAELTKSHTLVGYEVQEPSHELQDPQYNVDELKKQIRLFALSEPKHPPPDLENYANDYTHDDSVPNFTNIIEHTEFGIANADFNPQRANIQGFISEYHGF